NSVPHAELWDISQKKILREFTRQQKSEGNRAAGSNSDLFSDGERPAGHGNAGYDMWHVFDNLDEVTLSPHTEELGQDLCWKWSDGSNVAAHGSLLVASSKWAVELKDSNLLLRNAESRTPIKLDTQPPSHFSLGTTFRANPDGASVLLGFKGQPASLFTID